MWVEEDEIKLEQFKVNLNFFLGENSSLKPKFSNIPEWVSQSLAREIFFSDEFNFKKWSNSQFLLCMIEL